MSNLNICKQCGECCRIFYINLSKDEFESGRFKTFFEDIDLIKDFSKASLCGANFLAKKEDGGCVYLKDNSCSIHTKRPQACRDFFCVSARGLSGVQSQE